MKSFCFFIFTLLVMSQSIYGQAPTMDCPGDVIVDNAIGSCGETVAYTIPTCATNCGGETIIQTDATGFTSGDVFPLGTTILEYTITSAGGSSTCSFNITVTDNENPSITCPANQNVSAGSNCSAILGDYISYAIITDNCDSSPLVTQSPVTLTTITTSQVVTLTATDASGNTATCNFLVTIDDSDPPAITCPSNETVFRDGNCDFILPDYTGSLVIVDDCDNNPTILQTPVPGTPLDLGATQFVSFDVTDLSGNFSVCSFLLTVADTTE